MTIRQAADGLRERLAGVIFVSCLCGGLTTLPAADLSLTLRQREVLRYDRVEMEIGWDGAYRNPFDPQEVSVTVLVRTPYGVELALPAFWAQPYQTQRIGQDRRAAIWRYPAGPPGWLARFAPAEVGQYSVMARLCDATGTYQSPRVEFTAGPSSSPGWVRVSQRDPRYLEFTGGAPFFPIGQNLAFIGEGQPITPARVESVLQRLSAHGANYLRVWTCCEDWAMALEARKSTWGRSWSWKPPFAQLPGAPAARQYVQLDAGQRQSITVAPSHRVALRPQTRYVVRGRARIDAPATLKLDLAGRQFTAPGAQAGAWQPLEWSFESGPNEWWLGRVQLSLSGAGQIWIDDLSLREAAGGPELWWETAVNRPVRGFYNPIDCAILDDLVETARAQRIYLQLCLLTRDAYMKDLRDPQSEAYARAIMDAQNLLRYAVARWGYATSVATWEYFNELDPGVPVERFYQELAEYLDRVDPYHHLRATSTWHPSLRDCQDAHLDVAGMHFYLRPGSDRKYDDEVAAAVGCAAWLREQARGKPALIDEFGLANSNWGLTDEMRTSADTSDFHNAIWASALSGASGTALSWWWERLDRHDHYPQYQPLARFLADVPWTRAQLQPSSATLSDPQLRLVALQGPDRLYAWLFDPAASFESRVIHGRSPVVRPDVQLQVRGLQPGAYQVFWWDTRSGDIVQDQRVDVAQKPLTLVAPKWQADVAVQVLPR